MNTELASDTIEFERVKLYPKQRDAIFTQARFSITEACTKSGKTAGCIAWLIEQAYVHGDIGHNYWWIAPVYTQAKIAYGRTKRALPRGSFTCNETDKIITLLHNGAVMVFKSGEKPDNLYGEDVYACVIDEATRMREESWIAIRTTLSSTGAPCRIIGNVKGRKNWVYKLGVKAKEGSLEGWEYHRITAYDAIRGNVLSKEEVLKARNEIPRGAFNELYLAEPTEDGSNPFGIKFIRALIMPMSNEPVEYWGWDLAKVFDWTAGVGLDRFGRVAAFHRFHDSWDNTVKRIIAATDGLPATVDATGVGDPIVERLQNEGGLNFGGYVFSQPSKQVLMVGLMLAIQNQETSFPEGVIVDELEEFTYEPTRTGAIYTAPVGFHDDTVCALALAIYCKNNPQNAALEAL